MKYSEILKNPEIIEYYEKGNQILGKLGYTDHATTHTRLVAERAAKILDAFGYGEHEQEEHDASGDCDGEVGNAAAYSGCYAPEYVGGVTRILNCSTETYYRQGADHTE